MAAYISNIVIDAGADFNQIFNLEDSANSPLDLTGYSATSKLKKHPASLNDKASFTVSFPNRTRDTFSEYKFTAENTAQFKSFMIKVVMTSTNQAKPPRVKNFRAIALRSFQID